MIGTAEAYAAADSLLARAADALVGQRATARDLLAAMYLEGLEDGRTELEATDRMAIVTLQAKIAPGPWVDNARHSVKS